MKKFTITSAILVVILTMSLCLVACGGDEPAPKPSEPSTPEVPEVVKSPIKTVSDIENYAAKTFYDIAVSNITLENKGDYTIYVNMDKKDDETLSNIIVRCFKTSDTHVTISEFSTIGDININDLFTTKKCAFSSSGNMSIDIAKTTRFKKVTDKFLELNKDFEGEEVAVVFCIDKTPNNDPASATRKLNIIVYTSASKATFSIEIANDANIDNLASNVNQEVVDNAKKTITRYGKAFTASSQDHEMASN